MKYIAILFLMLLTSSCSRFDPKDLKSPCAATELSIGEVSPCNKRPANTWLV